MIGNVVDSLVRVVILDVSGIYVQIYDQGYFKKDTLDKIKQKYSDSKFWNVLVLD